jgi:hypothetical protein
MEVDMHTNDGNVGLVDYKAKVRNIYPEAECVQHGRRTYYIVSENGKHDGVIRYQYDIFCGHGVKISTSTYTEEGAWEYAWHYVEKRMMYLLEN